MEEERSTTKYILKKKVEVEEKSPLLNRSNSIGGDVQDMTSNKSDAIDEDIDNNVDDYYIEELVQEEEFISNIKGP